MRTPLFLLAATLVAAVALPSAQSASSEQSDLDAFMSQVLRRRDDNWKKLQQYVLDEDERFQVTGPEGTRLWGAHREYTWFPRDGFFVRSPVKVDGVTISDAERRKAEETWIATERRRDERRKDREARGRSDRGDTDVDVDASGATPSLDEVVHSNAEPRFVSSAYFMRFRFDPGHYALVGRETLLGQAVLRIEYYPSRLFHEGRTRPNKRLRDDDDTINQKLNKVAFVTLWVEPTEHQILQYNFHNIDMDFLPGRSIVRLDDLEASMRMGQPFSGVWLPDTIAMQFGMTLALGTVAAKYDVHYHDYRLADVKTKVR